MKRQPSITTASLDAGGVLVNPNWDRVAGALATQGVHVHPGALAAAEPLAKWQFDRATTIQSTNDAQRGWLYFNLVLEGAGVRPSDRTAAALEELRLYHAAENLWETVTPGAREALAALRRRGLSLIVVSNANGRLVTLLERVGLSSHFDVIVDSCLEGVEKPDARLFEIAMARAGAEPARTVHVGDLYHVDVVGARAAGMHPVLVDVADLYPDADCPRVRSINELPALLPLPQSAR